MAAPQLTLTVQGLTVLSADQMNTYEQTCDSIAELRGFSGSDGVQVFVRGSAVPGDGGQGVFIWELVTSPVDDGISTIVPYGTTAAAWIRIPLVGQIIPVMNVTSGSSVTLSNSNYLVNVNKAIGSATTVNLPTNPALGQVFVVKDGRGDASVNNITVSGGSYHIDGATTYVISTDWQSINVVFNGTGWGVW